MALFDALRVAKKRKPKSGTPDPFQYLDVNPEPVDGAVVEAALSRFVDAFVVKSKRERAKLLLLSSKKRVSGIRELWSWLDSNRTQELEGSTGFPQNLKSRFPDLRGIFVDEEQTVRVTAAEAAVLGLDSSLFISDDGKTALVFLEIGPPILCQAG